MQFSALTVRLYTRLPVTIIFYQNEEISNSRTQAVYVTLAYSGKRIGKL